MLFTTLYNYAKQKHQITKSLAVAMRQISQRHARGGKIGANTLG
jgi:hypothetical protein